MNGYVAQPRGRFYAVIHEGRDPIAGKELRRWHPAATDRSEAENWHASSRPNNNDRSLQAGR